MVELTDQQKAVVSCDLAKAVVRASPGSGKTFCTGKRLERLLKVWKRRNQGVAVLSFTNAACEEIKAAVLDDLGQPLPIGHPHFIGTLDSFINQFLFLPHAHLVTKCKRRPDLVGPPVGTWAGNVENASLGYVFFTNLVWQADGSLTRAIPNAGPTNALFAERYNNVVSQKRGLNSAGYFTMSDALYYTSLLVKRYPAICKSIAQRFPVLIIDEAQDTSQMHMDIIHALSAAGVEQILLVGDPDQSIYEWNKAEPSLLIQLRQEWNPDLLELSENWRSSQKVCDFTFRLSSLPGAATATNEDYRGCACEPVVIGYDDADTAQLGSRYFALLNENLGVGEWNPSEVAILVRSGGLLRVLADESQVTDDAPWTSPHTERLCKTRMLVEAGEMKRAFAQAERVVAGVILGEPNPSHEVVAEVAARFGLLKWRERVASVMLNLPKSSLDLGDWIAAAQLVLRGVFRDKAPTLKIKQASRQTPMRAFHTKERKCLTEQGLPVKTVHAVKGATLDSVMVVLKTKGTGRTYRKLLEENVSLTEDEELRIVYVGLTRPRRLVVLAVPNADLAAWQQKFGMAQAQVQT